MSELEYDQNYATWLTAAGITPPTTPINLRGVVHAILQNLGGSAGLIRDLTSTGGTITVTNPTGPTTNIETALLAATSIRPTVGTPTALATDQNGDFALDTTQTNPVLYGPFSGNGISGTWPTAIPLVAVRNQPSWAYLPNNWNAGWKTALAAQSVTPALLAAVGDSITAGQNATPDTADWLTASYFGVLRTNILARQGVTAYADHYPVQPYNTTTQSTFHASYTPYTVTSSGSNFGEVGLFRNVRCDTGSIVFTSPTGVIGMDIMYVDYSAGTWTYNVDSGGTHTITTSGLTGGVIKTNGSLTGLTAGSHVLTMNGASGGNVLLINGVTCYYGTTGVGFTRLGFCSARLTDFVVGAGTAAGASGLISAPADKIGLLGSSTLSAEGTSVMPCNPHLAIIELGLNDSNGGSAPTAYGFALRRMIKSLRKGNETCSIVLMAVANPYQPYSDNTVTVNGIYNYYRFKSEMLSAAQEEGCAYIDIDAKWGLNPVASGLQVSGDVHPTATGHTDIANALVTIGV